MGYHVTIIDVLQAADRVAVDVELASVVGQQMNVVCNPGDLAIRFILSYYYRIPRSFYGFNFFICF